MDKYEIIDVFNSSPYNFKSSFVLCIIECENIKQATEYVKQNFPIHYEWGNYGYFIKKINSFKSITFE